MRVAVFIEPWVQQRAGISVFTENMVKSVKYSKHTFVTIGSKRLDKSLEHIFIPAWKASYFNPLRYSGLLKVDLADYNIDLIIDPGHYSTIGLFKGTKRFVVVHDITPTLFPKYHRLVSVIAQKLFMKKSLKNCDKVIAVSDQTKNDVAVYYGFDQKIHRIYPGLRDLDSHELESSTFLQADPFILAVGTIEPRKNHENLIKAFDIFCQNESDVNLIIVGSEGWKVKLGSLIEASPNKHRIRYLGFVSKDHLAALYKQASMAAYVSIYEGFGFPVLEAMKMGCPVITSDVGSMKEIAGNAARIVNPNSESQIAEAMSELWNDLDMKDRLVRLGVERSILYSWQNFIKSLDALIDD